mgnify:CR=1 FL=1
MTLLAPFEPGEGVFGGSERGGGERADDDLIVLLPDSAKATNFAEIDEQLGVGEPELEQREEAIAPGDELGVTLAQDIAQRDRLERGHRHALAVDRVEAAQRVAEHEPADETVHVEQDHGHDDRGEQDPRRGAGGEEAGGAQSAPGCVRDRHEARGC